MKVSICALYMCYSSEGNNSFPFLPPAYVVRREGNVLTSVCQSVHREGGYLPSQVWTGGGVPGQVQAGGGYLARSSRGGYLGRGGVPWPGGGGGYLAGGGGGYLARRGRGGGVPGRKECLLCSGRYASCVHAGGLSCFFFRNMDSLSEHSVASGCFMVTTSQRDEQGEVSKHNQQLFNQLTALRTVKPEDENDNNIRNYEVIFACWSCCQKSRQLA